MNWQRLPYSEHVVRRRVHATVGAKRAAMWQMMILFTETELRDVLKVAVCHLKGLSHGPKISGVMTLQLCSDSFEAADHPL